MRAYRVSKAKSACPMCGQESQVNTYRLTASRGFANDPQCRGSREPGRYEYARECNKCGFSCSREVEISSTISIGELPKIFLDALGEFEQISHNLAIQQSEEEALLNDVRH